MPGALRAVAAVVAMVASFAAVLLLMRAPREDALPPDVAELVRRAPGAAARPGAAPPPPPVRHPVVEHAEPDADEWLHQLAAAAEAREEAQREAIFSFPEDPDATLDQKLEHYWRNVREAFAQLPDLEPADQRDMLTEVFLRNESVQAQLAALGPGARRRELAHIRREMGFAEEEIARLEELDALRETRWQKGLAYMEERRRLAATFEGGVFETELAHLRERHFGRRAKTIAAEEERGFFRFERPRVYGRN